MPLDELKRQGKVLIFLTFICCWQWCVQLLLLLLLLLTLPSAQLCAAVLWVNPTHHGKWWGLKLPSQTFRTAIHSFSHQRYSCPILLLLLLLLDSFLSSSIDEESLTDRNIEEDSKVHQFVDDLVQRLGVGENLYIHCRFSTQLWENLK